MTVIFETELDISDLRRLYFESTLHFITDLLIFIHYATFLGIYPNEIIMLK